MSKFLQVTIFAFAFCQLAGFAQNSVLSEGDWYKLSIEKDGVYRLSYSFLKDIGLNPDNIDPKKIKIYGNGSGMLPQANDEARPADLIENSIWISGEEDGKFDAADHILFYAQGADHYTYDNEGVLHYDHNIYSDHNYYFLTIGKNNGLRMTTANNEGTSFPKITTFNAFRYYEKDDNNLLSSGREWYSEKYNSINLSHTYTFSFPEMAANSDIEIISAVMAQSYAESSFSVALNGVDLGEQYIESIPDYRESIFKYSVKGKENRQQFTINSDQINDKELSVTLRYHDNNSGRSVGFLNYLLIEAICQLQLTDAYTLFRSLESTNNTQSTFEIKGMSSQAKVWDVTSPLAPAIQKFNLSGSTASFGTTTTDIKEYVVFDPSKLAAPEFTEKISNQNIRSINTPDMLIVSHPDFISEAKRLAAFRASHDQLQVAVVTTNEVYNEFSSGKQDVAAIRDFTRHLYNKGSRLKYLLLFGKSSYDYKDILEDNTNFVPIYESRNSLHPLNTYASDDFYGFLGDDEGEWPEQKGGNHTLEIGVGRLPVSTVEESKSVVDKIITYSSNPKSLGSWRKKVVFVADDGDNNIHAKQSDQLSVLVDTAFSNFNYKKIYLDAYPQVPNPQGETSPKSQQALNETVENGALVVNFTGHGREEKWMQEDVLNIYMIEHWSNIYRLPLFVTATCEFGRHDNPQITSGGELILTNPQGGGIAIISTSRPVFSSSNFALTKAFYKEIFRTENGQHLRLGDIIRVTKNNSIDQAIDANKVGNRNFALLGDPSLRLNYPHHKIRLTTITGTDSSADTLKALDKITISGQVENVSGVLVSAFNGELHAVVYDRELSLTTLGNQNSPYTYKSRENALFRGTVTINDGKFQFEFVVPKNISYQPGKGKISLYARDIDRNIDAGGSAIDLSFRGSVASPPHDTSGPHITLYLGDSTYSGSSIVRSNTLLVAKLKDENGINVSKHGIGNNITATLDGEETFVLNDYYTASSDTYQEGWVLFPINDLSKGEHMITLKAWDTHNNSGEATIKFMVSDPNSLIISNLTNYPNPFHDRTTLAFEHNRSGEDLDVKLQILSGKGEVVKDLDYVITESTARVELMEWDGTNISGKKHPPGIYLIKVLVRSQSDGAKNQKYQKLILIY